MRPIDFPKANWYFNKPTTMDDAECLPISAYAGQNDKGMPYINTVWQPNKEDIEAIVAGRTVVVSVIGYELPPMSLFTCDENGEPNF
jgi:hypothetical protein